MSDSTYRKTMLYLRAFQRRVRLVEAKVPCRLYEQAHHSFVMTEQERDLKDPRQPTKIVIQTILLRVVKLTMSTGCMSLVKVKM